MKLEDILAEWDKDAQIDRSELGEETLRISKLHSKYWNIYCEERNNMRALEHMYNELYRDKYQWYSGVIDDETLSSRGWSPNPLRILRADMDVYLKADSDLLALSIKIDKFKDKIKFLEDAIKSLVARGYNIKSAIDWERFKVGA